MTKPKAKRPDKKNGVTVTAWTGHPVYNWRVSYPGGHGYCYCVRGHPVYNWRVSYPDGAKRRSKGFKTKTGQGGAIEFAEKKRGNIAKDGTRHEEITNEERLAVMSFRNLVAELPASIEPPKLADAVTLFREHHKIRQKSKSVQEIVDQYTLSLQRKDVSESYFYATERRLKRFVADYAEWQACDMSAEVVADWLEDLELGPQTTNHYRAVLVQLFNHAVDMEVVEKNPIAKVAKKKAGATEIGILTVLEVKALLGNACDEILPGLALGLFAGVRRAELCRMDWSEIDFEQDLVEITAAKAKTASRRLIPLRENLKSWLLPHRQAAGPIMPSEMIWRTRLEDTKQAAGITCWPHNCLRHSFCSYHLAHFKDAGALALEMGHGDTKMIFAHYRALVTPKKGAEYWDATP